MFAIVSSLMIVVLALPALAVIILSLQEPVSSSVLITTVVASLVACALWIVWVVRQYQLKEQCKKLLSLLNDHVESRDKLLQPLQSLETSGDPVARAVYVATERLCKRREQIRSTLDKIGEIMTNVSLNKSIDFKAEDFDMPDSDDRTVLLGILCQLITTLQHSRQRGDVFAKVLRESPIAMLITGPQMEIRSLNPAAEKLLGCSQQKVLHKIFTDFFVAPPLKEQHAHLKNVVLNGHDALAELKNGKQEVFTTIRARDGMMKLIGIRASFGSNCLFVIRERSREKMDEPIVTPEMIQLKSSPTVLIPEAVAG